VTSPFDEARETLRGCIGVVLLVVTLLVVGVAVACAIGVQP
jgi:AMMECR1 domain-containing protein